MADDQQAYDYTTDPEFIKANPQDQKAYLSHVDPEFAKAAPNDQGAYLSHIKGYDQPTEFEKERAPVEGGVVKRFAKGVGSGAKAFKPSFDPLDLGLRGIDPTGSLSTIRNLYQGYHGAREAGQPRGEAAAEAAGGLMGINAPAVREKAKHGDIAGVIGEAVPAVGATLLGGKLAEHFSPEAMEARRAEQGPQKITKALATPPGKAGARAAQMAEDLRVATPDLAEIERETPSQVSSMLKRGQGAETFKKLADDIEDRQDRMWEEGHKPGIERHGQAEINNDTVVNAGRAQLTPEAVRANSTEAAASNKWLAEQEQPTTLASADKLIREINDDLRGKDAANKYGPLQVRVRQAFVKALRAEVDRVLDESGEHGVRDVNRRWGALGNISDRLRERAVQEANREARGGPLPDWVHVYTFLHPDLSMAVGAGVRLGGMLRTSPSTTLARGMRQLGRTGLEAPFEATPPAGWGKPPVGLLPPASPPQSPPLITPPPRGIGLYPEESSVHGVPAQHVEGYSPVQGTGNRVRPEYEGGEGRLDYPVPKAGSLEPHVMQPSEQLPQTKNVTPTSRWSIEPNTDPEETPGENPHDLQDDNFNYAIKAPDGSYTGAHLIGELDGKKATVRFIGNPMDDGWNPGPKALRDVLDNFKKEHPGVTSIRWNRVSGAQAGPIETPLKARASEPPVTSPERRGTPRVTAASSIAPDPRERNELPDLKSMKEQPPKMTRALVRKPLGNYQTGGFEMPETGKPIKLKEAYYLPSQGEKAFTNYSREPIPAEYFEAGDKPQKTEPIELKNPFVSEGGTESWKKFLTPTEHQVAELMMEDSYTERFNRELSKLLAHGLTRAGYDGMIELDSANAPGKVQFSVINKARMPKNYKPPTLKTVNGWIHEGSW